MRRRNKLLLAVAAGATMGTLFYFHSPQLNSLGKLIRIARSLSPTSARAGDGDAAAKPAGPLTISPKTRAAVAKIKTGMTRAQVERILGQCNFAKSEPGPDGRAIWSLAWLRSDDMICVHFADAVVTVVGAAALTDLAEAPAGAAQPTGQGMQSFQNRVRRLEEQLKANRRNEEALQQVLDAVAEDE